MNSHDAHTREILAEIERGKGVTQRSLSKRLGIALGLTNSLIRRLVNKGYVKVVNVRPNRVTYLITPAGIVEKARATRSYLERTLTLYTETRQHVHASLLAAGHNGNGNGRTRIAFYGAGDIAEIAYIGLQGTDLDLVAIIDERRTGSFFGTEIRRPGDLRGATVAGIPFDRLIVLDFAPSEEILATLASAGVPGDHVRWLE